MDIEVVYDVPPIFDEIVKVFPGARNERVVFSWGSRVYINSKEREPVPKPIIAHESIHGSRQTIITRSKLREKGVNDFTAEHAEEWEWEVLAWWRRYMRDEKFRYDEELLAHQEEYRVACAEAISRRQRQFALKTIAKKLASPLYGSMVSPAKAKTLLKQAA